MKRILQSFTTNGTIYTLEEERDIYSVAINGVKLGSYLRIQHAVKVFEGMKQRHLPEKAQTK